MASTPQGRNAGSLEVSKCGFPASGLSFSYSWYDLGLPLVTCGVTLDALFGLARPFHLIYDFRPVFLVLQCWLISASLNQTVSGK